MLLLPEPSTTVHVTVVVPSKNVVGALLVTETTEQLSLATGVPNASPVTPHVADEDTVIADGATIVGKMVSFTVTVCVAVAVFPLASVTVHVTVVLPNGYVLNPLLTTVVTEQLSATTGIPNTTFTATQLLFVETITFAGAVIVGTVVSTTVTVCVAVLTLPEPSVTVQVIVVVPNGNTVGALFVVLATEQLSAVTGVPSAIPVAEQVVDAAVVIFAGAIILGKILSCTVTTAFPVLTFP